MDTISYVALTRQTGLLNELQVVANNLANMSTTGFRAEGVVFAEMVEALPAEGGSIAMTEARVRYTNALQGALERTGGTLDLGIQGDGFFQIETPDGNKLSRNGAFATNAESELVTMDGYPVLDASGARIFVPPDAANISIASDGTLSADGNAVAQVGLLTVDDFSSLTRSDGVMFVPDGPVRVAEGAVVMQGFLEQSNVNPVVEITRMIEVQRAYELGQRLLEKDDERIRTVVRTLGAAV